MSAFWFIIAGALILTVVVTFVVWASKSTPTLEDSMAVPREEPVYKGIAEDLRKQAAIESAALAAARKKHHG